MNKDIIARLEAATKPSRELDAEIAKHLGWTTFMFGGAGPCWKNPEGRIMAECPHYTGSIDAAIRSLRMCCASGLQQKSSKP